MFFLRPILPRENDFYYVNSLYERPYVQNRIGILFSVYLPMYSLKIKYLFVLSAEQVEY